jgi:hypothetical protein
MRRCNHRQGWECFKKTEKIHRDNNQQPGGIPGVDFRTEGSGKNGGGKNDLLPGFTLGRRTAQWKLESKKNRIETTL